MSVIEGTVIDAQTQQPIPDVVIMATAPQMQGEQTVVSNSQGDYRFPVLPPGDFKLEFQMEGFKTNIRRGIKLGEDDTVRVNVEMLPQFLENDAANS